MNPLENFKPPNISLNLMGYAVEWSPFDEKKLAVACAQNFGIVGSGQLQIYDVYNNTISSNPIIQDCNDGVFDISWSEMIDTQLIYSCGNGSINLYDFNQQKIIMDYLEHTAEVYSCDWNMISKEHFISGSWDNTIKLWHPAKKNSIKTFIEHTGCIYNTSWQPNENDIFASVAGDCKLKIWDINTSSSVQTIHVSDFEVLCCDWNKYNNNLIYTGSVDKIIREWDLRMPSKPTLQLNGHDFAIRRIKTSPHNKDIIASCSYDMSLCIWNLQSAIQDNLRGQLLKRYEHHTEFVLGCDFNLFNENQIASVSWDETLAVWYI